MAELKLDRVNKVTSLLVAWNLAYDETRFVFWRPTQTDTYRNIMKLQRSFMVPTTEEVLMVAKALDRMLDHLSGHDEKSGAWIPAEPLSELGTVYSGEIVCITGSTFTIDQAPTAWVLAHYRASQRNRPQVLDWEDLPEDLRANLLKTSTDKMIM